MAVERIIPEIQASDRIGGDHRLKTGGVDRIRASVELEDGAVLDIRVLGGWPPQSETRKMTTEARYQWRPDVVLVQGLRRGYLDDQDLAKQLAERLRPHIDEAAGFAIRKIKPDILMEVTF